VEDKENTRICSAIGSHDSEPVEPAALRTAFGVSGQLGQVGQQPGSIG
jgi:hypothetical protein